MPDIDVFTLWRWMLFIVVTIYTLIVLGQTLWGYYAWLWSGDRYTTILRRYVLVHTLRVRAGTFGPDLAVCGLLCVVLGLLAWLHVMAVHRLL